MERRLGLIQVQVFFSATSVFIFMCLFLLRLLLKMHKPFLFLLLLPQLLSLIQSLTIVGSAMISAIAANEVYLIEVL